MNKKTDKANLEKKKILFFQTGFIIALSVSVFVLEYKQPKAPEEKVKVFFGEPEFISEILIDSSEIKIPKPKGVAVGHIAQVKDNQNPTQDIEISTEVLQESNNIKKNNPEQKQNETFIQEKKASFPGGIQAMNEFILNHLQYPPKAKAKKIQGRVYLSFTIETDGTINKIQIINSSHQLLNKEAVRIVAGMPQWIPAEYNAIAVNTQHTISIIFKL
ncbi:MAG: TonB family protein [Bacteroidota bacterium]|nr:TonB family protein [Bacteroidota bacterium]